MAQSFSERMHPGLRYFIGDVRDAARLNRALEGIDVVVHAAALKQVPAAEYNPFECIKTNVLGAQNVIEACLDQGVQSVVALSTDKAAAPINLYGATKLCSDKLFVAANNIKGKRDLRFSVVRYGNVMGSRGSVIPFFLAARQRRAADHRSGDDALQHLACRRAWTWCCGRCEHAWAARSSCPRCRRTASPTWPPRSAPTCEQVIVGIRPGEKIHEEMITASDSLNTLDLGDYYAILPAGGEYGVDEYVARTRPDASRPASHTTAAAIPTS